MKRLSPAMKRTLRIMGEGHEVRFWWDEAGRPCYGYHPPKPEIRFPRKATLNALLTRGLIQSAQTFEAGYLMQERWSLTEAGRRAAEGQP